jgi:hypothetical protein
MLLVFLFLAAIGQPQDPPPDLARRAAKVETETQAARNNYTYRQTVTLEEMDSHGGVTGQYHEVRDIIFSPQRERSEVVIGRPSLTLRRLILTEEDFQDIREIQPFILTQDQLWTYESKFRGEEQMDGNDCWVLQVRPRQILAGQRLFDGMLWINKKDFAIVRAEGQAVPQILSTRQQNLFPRFTTVRRQVEGKHWFPVFTFADDVLPFRGGPQRERLRIRYSDYKKFGAESSITFQK